FRTDFENQMSTDLANFHLVLAARINRLDSATTTQTTALGAALAAPGTANVTAPEASASSVLQTTNNLFPSSAPSLFGGPNPAVPGLTVPLGANRFGALPATADAKLLSLGLGVDPTVYLDEKKRFLDHLNQIRRINHGPDQNDASGYGLYLVRVPVSITPGECTYHGHGAEIAVTVEHEFPKDFLKTTFRNLVINDLVDQLAPVVYEAIRSDKLEDLRQYRELLAQFSSLSIQMRKSVLSMWQEVGRASEREFDDLLNQRSATLTKILNATGTHARS